jgi:hypothetical protein
MNILAQTPVDVAGAIDLVSELIKKVGIPGTAIIIMVVGVYKFARWSKPYLVACFESFQERQQRIAISHENMANKVIELNTEGMVIHKQNSDTLKQGMETLKKNTELTAEIQKGVELLAKNPPQQPRPPGFGR